MSQTRKPNKVKIALVGSKSTPVLFTGLRIAFGLCGAWEKIIVVGSSPKNDVYLHMGSYNTLYIPPDAPPSRYAELLNIVAACGKEVVVLSSLSNEWKEGVTRHLKQNHYEEVLRSHNSFMKILSHFPAHVVGCIQSERNLIRLNTSGLPQLDLSHQLVQQPGFEKNFTMVLRMDKKGRSEVVKDLSQTLPTQPFYPTYQTGAVLQDWCRDGKPYVPEDLQQKIDQCSNISELYQLLFDVDIEDMDLIGAFTKRRMELMDIGDRPPLEAIEGGLI